MTDDPPADDLAGYPIDPKLLNAFLTVAREGQIGRAARRLAIAQSPLSRQIMRLESHLGVRLLDRSHDGVRMTRAGEVLYREGPALLQSLRAIAVRTQRAALTKGID